MQMVLKLLKWGGIPLGALVYALGLVSQARDAGTWGIPTWVWLLVGYLLSVATAAAIAIGFWRDNRNLQKQLEHLKTDAEPLLNEQRRRLRAQMQDRLQIPSLLFQMFERARVLVEEDNKAHPLTQTDYDKFGNKLRAAGYLRPNSKMVTQGNYLSRFDNPLDIPSNRKALKVLNSFKIEIDKFLLSLQGIMSSDHRGSMALVETDAKYSQLLARVRKLEKDLPDALCSKVEGHLVMGTSMADLSYFDVSGTAPAGILAILPYHKQMVSLYVRKLNSDIHKVTENFLAGEDV